MRKEILASLLGLLLFAICFSVEAQQATKIPRIGYLARREAPTLATPDASTEAFRQGLQEFGYSEGKNILIEYRYAQGMEERFPGLVAELVQLKIDALVSPTLPGIRAAKQATKTIPIVMVTTQDPVASGLIDSLARPGGNITGLARLTRELSGKRLEMFKDAVPEVSRVGVLGDATALSSSLKVYEAASRAMKIRLYPLEVRGPSPDFERAFQTATKQHVNGIITASTVLLVSHPKRIADLAIRNRLPSMYERGDYVEVGGLMSYAASEVEGFRRAAYYVDKILKGAKPADLPVEQPTKFEFIVNLKTAKQIGVTIPPNVLARADKVIR